MSNVVILPGFMGSELDDVWGPGAGQRSRLWINPIRLWRGAVVRLQLAADGHSAGPLAGGATIRTGPPLAACYGLLAAAAAAAGYRVASLGWDWRQGLRFAGLGLAQALPTLFGGQPAALLCHSAGGLVARCALKFLRQSGQDSLISRIVYLGTPQYGCFLPLAVLGRYHPMYIATAGIQPPARQDLPLEAVASVDAALCSLVSFFELLPFRRSGPLPSQQPAAADAIYSAASYAGFQPGVAQGRLDGADGTQQFLADAGDPARERIILGTGFQTFSGCANPAALGARAAYRVTGQGDGIVSRDYATRPGIPTFTLAVDHFGMCLYPAVWALALSQLPPP